MEGNVPEIDNDTPQNPDEPPAEPKAPVVASYQLRVNIRGDASTGVPTNTDLAGMVQREIASNVYGPGVSVTVTAERLDK